LNRLEKIKKKVQGVVDTPDTLDGEKMQQLKKIYQNAKQVSRPALKGGTICSSQEGNEKKSKSTCWSEWSLQGGGP